MMGIRQWIFADWSRLLCVNNSNIGRGIFGTTSEKNFHSPFGIENGRGRHRRLL